MLPGRQEKGTPIDASQGAERAGGCQAKEPGSELMGHLDGRLESLPGGSLATLFLPDTGTNAWPWGHWLTKVLLPCSFPSPEQQGPEMDPCASLQQMFLSSSYLGFSHSLPRQLGFLFSLGTRLFLVEAIKRMKPIT